MLAQSKYEVFSTSAGTPASHPILLALLSSSLLYLRTPRMPQPGFPACKSVHVRDTCSRTRHGQYTAKHNAVDPFFQIRAVASMTFQTALAVLAVPMQIIYIRFLWLELPHDKSHRLPDCSVLLMRSVDFVIVQWHEGRAMRPKYGKVSNLQV